MYAKLVNLTPHVLSIIVPIAYLAPEDARRIPPFSEAAMSVGSAVLDLPPSGIEARCRVEQTRSAILKFEGFEVPVYDTAYGALEGLPAPEEGVVYVASLLAAKAAAALGRSDVLCPGTLRRGADGQPIGCVGLARP